MLEIKYSFSKGHHFCNHLYMFIEILPDFVDVAIEDDQKVNLDEYFQKQLRESHS